MLKLSFDLAVTIVIIISLGLVFLLWIFYNLAEDKIAVDSSALRQCPFCTYIFFNYANKNAMEQCPRCNSRFESNETVKKI